MAAPTAYRGVFPVVPTAFTTSGELDLTSQLRIIDYLINTNVDGICILASDHVRAPQSPHSARTPGTSPATRRAGIALVALASWHLLP